MLTGRLRRRDDVGVSLIELLVAMGLMTILGAITARLFITVNSSASATTDRAVNATSAGALMQAWDGYLRVADGTTPGSLTNRFEWLTANDALFYADINNRATSGTGLTSTGSATMVWLRLDSNNALIEEQFPQNAAKGAQPTRCRRLLANASPGDGDTITRLFTAINPLGSDMNSLDLGTAPTPTAGCQALPVTVPSQANNPDPAATANLANVTQVRINFIVVDSAKSHPIGFSSWATLPTLGGAQ